MNNLSSLIEESKRLAEKWNLPGNGSKWYTKHTSNYEQWRTRMYGFGSFRLYDQEKKFSLNKSLPTIDTLFRDNTKGVNDLYLYLHIPYCKKRCSFCYYVTEIKASHDMMRKYIDSVLTNIDLLVDACQSEIKPSSIHFGGGTPTLIGAELMERLLEGIQERIDLSKVKNWTVETSPDSIISDYGKDVLGVMHANKVNRLSIGIQTFNDKILSYTSRSHNVNQSIEAIKIARETGFKNINIDLLLGLPKQSIETWQETLKKFSSIQTESVSLYYIKWLDYFDNQKKLYNLKEKKPDLFPSNTEILHMNIMLLLYLEKLGYVQNRPCSWTKSENYFVYSDYCDILPLGVSGFGFYNNYHFRNTSDINQYVNDLDNKRLPLIKDCSIFTEEHLFRRQFSTEIQFLNKNGYDLFKFKNEKSSSIKKHVENFISELESEGMIHIDSDKIMLTKKGTLCADEIVKYIMNY